MPILAEWGTKQTVMVVIGLVILVALIVVMTKRKAGPGSDKRN